MRTPAATPVAVGTVRGSVRDAGGRPVAGAHLVAAGKWWTEADASAVVRGTADAGGTVADYTIAGMTCSHCVKAVTEEVSALPGVTDVQVDLDSGALKVTSQGPVDVDRIVEALAEAGDWIGRRIGHTQDWQ